MDLDIGVPSQHQAAAPNDPQISPPRTNLEFLWTSSIILRPDLGSLAGFAKACQDMKKYTHTLSGTDYDLILELVCQIQILCDLQDVPAGSNGAEWDDFWKVSTSHYITRRTPTSPA